MKQFLYHPSSKVGVDEFDEPQISVNIPRSDPKTDKSVSLICLQDYNENISPILPQQKWVKKGLQVLFYVSKFIKQMKNNSTKFKLKSLNSHMLSLIKDNASESNIFLNKSTTNTVIQEYLTSIGTFIPTLEPDSIFRILWLQFVLIISIVNIFYIPLKIGFQLNNYYLEQFPAWVFISDILLNLITAYYKKGENYFSLQGGMLWDILIVFPVFLPFDEAQYIQLLRITKVPQILENIEELLNPEERIKTLFQLFKAIFLIVFLTHFCACLWNLIGEYQQHIGQTSWLIKNDLLDADWITKYITSLYFSTVTTITVGYGDITPTTNLERIFVVVMILLVCGVLGYTISSIGNILKQLNEKEQNYKQKINSINRYLNKLKINKQLHLQIRKYFEYYVKKELDSNEIGEEYLRQLTQSLKEQLQVDLYFEVLLKSRIIKSLLSQETIKKLCQFIQVKKFQQDEIIVQKNDIANSLLFLHQGEVAITCKLYNHQGNYNGKETVISSINNCRALAEREFLTQQSYEYSIKANKYTKILYIRYQLSINRYEDLISVLGQEQEAQSFFMARDQQIFNEDSKQNIGNFCDICQWTHKFTKCPFVFYNPNYEKMRYNYKLNYNQERQPKFKRKLKKKPMEQIQDTKWKALTYLMDHNFIQTQELSQSNIDSLGLQIFFDHQKFKPQESLQLHTIQSDSSSSKESSKYKQKVPTMNQLMHQKISSQIMDQRISIYSSNKQHRATQLLQKKLSSKISKQNTENDMIKQIEQEMLQSQTQSEFQIDSYRNYIHYFTKFNIDDIALKNQVKNRNSKSNGLITTKLKMLRKK
ncbi:hypothetical protein pb186bvf_009150 [Paramecium bursaria]